jgi:spore cortex formation protein SpoVR/YcgB (stage V sporulation)
MEKIVQEAKEKKCSLSELIRQKIMFAYEQEDKEKTIIDLQKMEDDIKSLKNMLIFNLAIIADCIRQEKGMDSWEEIFKKAKEIVEEYRKTGKLFI